MGMLEDKPNSCMNASLLLRKKFLSSYPSLYFAILLHKVRQTSTRGHTGRQPVQHDMVHNLLFRAYPSRDRERKWRKGRRRKRGHRKGERNRGRGGRDAQGQGALCLELFEISTTHLYMVNTERERRMLKRGEKEHLCFEPLWLRPPFGCSRESRRNLPSRRQLTSKERKRNKARVPSSQKVI